MTTLLDVTRRGLPSSQFTQVALKKSEPHQVKHLYRSLLRATSYIPDSFARIYLREHITKRFRNNTKREAIPSVIKNRVKKARHACRVLEGASEGRADDLKDVFMRVYGRKGARKRVLLEDLIRKDEDQVPKDDRALQELIANPNGRQATAYEPGTKFFQFLRSQQANQPLEFHSNSIKQLQPTIPKMNIWLRPVPLKAQRGMRQKWWALTLDKILPPVPAAEWHRLEGFATGTIPLEEAPVRRAAPSNRDPASEWSYDVGSVLDFLNHRAKLDRPTETRIELDGLSKESNTIGSQIMNAKQDAEFVKFDTEKGLCVHENATQIRLEKPSGPLSQRTLRRLYAAIWNMTPTMVQDEATKNWDIKWGGLRSAAHNGEISTPSEAQKEFFEGLEGISASARKKGKGTGPKDQTKIPQKKNSKSRTENPRPK